MVVVTIVNAYSKSIFADFGVKLSLLRWCFGITYRKFYNMLVNNELNLPQPENVPNTASYVLYDFIDEAFPLQADFLKPFNQRELTPETNAINYCLIRAR